jgi:hypothetical protein
MRPEDLPFRVIGINSEDEAIARACAARLAWQKSLLSIEIRF